MKTKILSALCVIMALVLVLPVMLGFKSSAAEEPDGTYAADEEGSSTGLLERRKAVHTVNTSISNSAARSTSSSYSFANKICRIRNAASSKYMNVHYGIDADGTNVYQFTADSSMEQDFYFFPSGTNGDNCVCVIFAMCSSFSFNRIIAHSTSGRNVVLTEEKTSYSSSWEMVPTGVTGQYYIVSRSNSNLYLTSYGTSNGTSTGTSTSSAGNIYVSIFTGSDNQKWYIDVYSNQYAVEFETTPYSSSAELEYVHYVVANKGNATEYDIANCPASCFEIPFVSSYQCGVNVYTAGYERKSLGTMSSSVTSKSAKIKTASDYGFLSTAFRNPISATIYQEHSSSTPAVTSQFGMRTYTTSSGNVLNDHNGIDIGVSVGTSVYSMCQGTVRAVDTVGNTSRGKYIEVSFQNSSGTTYYLIYQHLLNVNYSVGSSVAKGTIIGTSGNSGNVDAHLHVGLSRYSVSSGLSESGLIDPAILMTITE